jgi:glycerol-3-phosphate acyltransferase PlsY
LGWVFGNHIWPKFQFWNGKNRSTGVAAMLLIAPMTLSGYLIQISTSEAIRYAMSVAHWISSGLFVVIYAIHLIKPPGAEVAE